MHSYLKAVGFSDIFGKKELDSILNNVINEYDEKIVAAGRAGHSFIELIKRYGDDFGIVVCGEYDENNEFQMEYYFPYFFGTGITLQEEVIIEKHAGHESFAGACDDMRIGVTIHLLSAKCRGISDTEKQRKLCYRCQRSDFCPD